MKRWVSWLAWLAVFIAVAFFVSRSEYIWLMLWARVQSAPVQFTVIVVVAAILLDFFAPHMGARAFGPIEKFGARLAARKRAAILAVAAAAILIRLALLPVAPVPAPEIHDEFSYLLAADTFAHGRLANPPHRLSIYFDTFHVNTHPTYVSIYPPAQGAVLALGEILGHPWVGVLLSTALMCGAVTWMLQGWLPPQWALLGGVLVLLRLGIFSYWMNSYWGGAVAAIGGALALGALPRILRSWRAGDALILGIGTAILANSRPFEGFILLVPVYVVLGARLLKSRARTPRVPVRQVLAPLCVVLILCGAFMLYYNQRTTGNALSFPYVLNVQSRFSIPLLAWQKTRPAFHFMNPQFDAYYNVWWKSVAWPNGRPDTAKNIRLALIDNGRNFGAYFLWPELCVPLLALPWLFRDRRTRFLIVQWVICFAGFILVAWFQPHYAAPLVATTFALIIQAVRHIRQWRLGGRPIGAGISRAIVLCALIFSATHTAYLNLEPSLEQRAKIAAELNARPGDQLVIVRYFAGHNPSQEWVYNGADIDHSKVVWAREIPGVSMQPLLDYFRGRRVWLVTPDSNPAKLSPYDPRAQGNESSMSGG